VPTYFWPSLFYQKSIGQSKRTLGARLKAMPDRQRHTCLLFHLKKYLL